MKKIVFIFLFLVLIFYYNSCVYAQFTTRNKFLSYDIESVEMTDDYISFSGYAFVHRVNNIGGVNTKISIIATNNSSLSDISISSLKNINYIQKNVNNYVERNLYMSECLKNSNWKCATEKTSMCFHKSNGDTGAQGLSNGDYRNVSCLYRNVGFQNVTFTFEELKNKFGDNQKIYFIIMVEVFKDCMVDGTYKSGTYSFEYETTLSSLNNNMLVNASGNGNFNVSCIKESNYYSVGNYLGIIGNNVLKLNGSFIDNSKSEYTYSNSNETLNLTVSKLNPVVTTNYPNTAILRINGGKNSAGSNIKLVQGKEYRIEGSSVTKSPNDLYPQRVVHLYDGGYNYNNYYYAFTSWLISNQKMYIMFGKEKKKEEIKTCSNNSNIRTKLNCYYRKGTYEYTTCKTYEKDVYFPSKYSDKNTCSYNKCIGNKCYIKSKISVNINFIQSGTLKFSQDPLSIYSGGPTHFGVEYSNSIYWEYKDNIKFYDYYDMKEVESCDLYGCKSYCKNELVSADSLKDSSLFDSNFKKYNNANEYIEELTKDELDTDFLSTLNGSTKISVPAGDIQGSWSTVTGYTVPNEWSAGKNNRISSSYIYNINNAFLDRNTGEVYYSTDITTNEDTLFRANTYYIPLDKKSGTYKFSFNIDDLSIMDNNDLFHWTNTYSCDVECSQKFYNDNNKGFKFNYRTIDINNVFPNDNAGDEWNSWIDKNSSYISNGNVSLKNLKVENLTVKLTSDLIEDIRSYNENKNDEGDGYLDDSIDKNGSSEFLKKYGFYNKASYYKLGCGSLSNRSECS